METTKEKIRSVLEQFSITQYQAERIANMILDYTQSNSLLEVSIPEQCPKCGIYRPEVVKNGKTGLSIIPTSSRLLGSPTGLRESSFMKKTISNSKHIEE